MTEPRGQIITFYSYKGGTGRTMALANVACVLAQREIERAGKGVLVVDWDLEAPGLHRFFGRRSAAALSSVVMDEAWTSERGLIDLAYELEGLVDTISDRDSAKSEAGDSRRSGEELARAVIERVDWKRFVLTTGVSGLSLIRAGRVDLRDPNEYAEQVNKFDWEQLYSKCPHLLRVLAETWAATYSYVLIDSRTGVTDTSGICTAILPEKLVVVFTPNTQSLKGALDLVRRATEYRQESSDLRPLLVFPLVSRVETTEPELRYDWRFGSAEVGVIGYQAEFEQALAHAYGKTHLDLTEYFEEMQLQHIPRFAYGEPIAVLVERTRDKFSLTRSYETFAQRLIEGPVPWDDAKPNVLQATPSIRATRPRRLSRFRRLVFSWRGATFVAIAFAFASLAAALSYHRGYASQTLRLTNEVLKNQAKMNLQLQNAKAQREQDALALQELRRLQTETEKRVQIAREELDSQEAELRLVNREKALTSAQLGSLIEAVAVSRRRLREAEDQAAIVMRRIESKDQLLATTDQQIKDTAARNAQLSMQLSVAGDKLVQLQGIIAGLQQDVATKTAETKACLADLDRTRGPSPRGGYPISTCAAPTTPICTPDGERPIASIRVGDPVYSIHEGRLTTVLVAEISISRVPPRHTVVAVRLGTDRVLEISGGHPTADGRRIDQLAVGERLGNAQVVALNRAEYEHAFTFDILPASDSGTYFAGGLLLGSTLSGGDKTLSANLVSQAWAVPNGCGTSLHR